MFLISETNTHIQILELNIRGHLHNNGPCFLLSILPIYIFLYAFIFPFETGKGKQRHERNFKENLIVILFLKCTMIGLCRNILFTLNKLVLVNNVHNTVVIKIIRLKKCFISKYQSLNPLTHSLTDH